MPDANNSLTFDQVVLLGILALTMGAFIWGRWRYDLVALTAVLVAAFCTLVPYDEVFSGFGHPAVVTVAAVLIISRALQNSGVIDFLTERLAAFTGSETAHVGALGVVAGALSAFMNNVGALALLMPVALRSAREAGRAPGKVLMPLSFASILGGMVTLIGTPPNVIVAAYRESAVGAPFALFDFAPVGGLVAVVGISFVALFGWRLLPARAEASGLGPKGGFNVQDYVIEVRIPEDSELVGKGLRSLEELCENAGKALSILRDGQRIVARARQARLRAGDVVVLTIDSEELDAVLTAAGLEIVGSEQYSDDDLRSDEVGLCEAVVTAGSALVQRNFAALRSTERHDLNLIGIARQGRPVQSRLERARLRPGDVLLVQGPADLLSDALGHLGCLTLAGRGLHLAKRPSTFVPLIVLAAALGVSVLTPVPVHVAFAAAVVALAVTNTVNLRDLYASIDWRVIVLLGSMIPLGQALEVSATTSVIAASLLAVAGNAGPLAVMVLLLVITMSLSDIMNNAATAVVMAPIAAALAAELGANPDAFLMAVAIGASCAFLTPIGHQNNVLVMGPGGYRFGDYWRLGLPLQILVVGLSVPLLWWVWPPL